MMAHIDHLAFDALRVVMIAGYGILLGSALYLWTYAFRHAKDGNDSYGGDMWRTVVWSQAGLIAVALLGAYGRFLALEVHEPPDARFFITPFVLVCLLRAQYLAFHLVRRRRDRKGG